jgi:uncharacterized protein (TIGR03083 family)
MDLWAAPTMDTRTQFRVERNDLLTLLDELPLAQWTASTPAEGWTVKDVALHLLDGDLGRLSRDRDGDATGLLPVSDDLGTFASLLADKNQRWLDGTRQLSPRVVRELLAFSTAQVSEWTTRADLRAARRVTWASEAPVPAWLDLARELTETWVHHQQIRAAVGHGTSTRRLPLVLRTFVWALPHQYRVAADEGTTVDIDLDTAGRWHLVAEGASNWTLEEGAAASPAAAVEFTAEAAWRSFTGAALPPHGVHQSGPLALTGPVLDVRGIIS